MPRLEITGFEIAVLEIAVLEIAELEMAGLEIASARTGCATKALRSTANAKQQFMTFITRPRAYAHNWLTELTDRSKNAATLALI